MRTATRVCLGLLAGAVVVLAASGVWLWFNYLPTAAQAWPTLKGPHAVSWVRQVHRVASSVVIWLALACLVLLVIRRVRTGGRGVVAGVALLVTALAASFTGYLLPWDQLALWAVTVGTNMRGIQPLFDSRAKYILIGSHEVSPSTYHFWAISHLVLGLLVAAAASLAWMRTHESRPAPEPDADPEPELVRSS